MCEMTPDYDGRTGQLGRCKECGADRLDHEPARFTGGAGSRSQPLSDEDYRREMDKLSVSRDVGEDGSRNGDQLGGR